MTTTSIIVLLLIGFIAGWTTCTVVTCLVFDRKDGVLKIDQTSPDRDLYSMQFDTPLEKIPKKKKVVFRVETVIRSGSIGEHEELERVLKELEDSQKLQRSI